MLNQDYTAKLLDLEDVIITGVENVSGQFHICLELPRRKHICPCCRAVTDRVHDYCMQVKMFLLPEIPFCTCVSTGIAVNVASVSLKRTLFSLAITVLLAAWLPKSCLLSKRPFQQRKSAAVIMCPLSLLCVISISLTKSSPNCRKLYHWMNSRAIPVDKNITASSRILKKRLFWMFSPITLKVI